MVSVGITYYLSSKSLEEHVTGELAGIAESKVQTIDTWLEGFRVLISTSATKTEYKIAVAGRYGSEQKTG